MRMLTRASNRGPREKRGATEKEWRCRKLRVARFRRQWHEHSSITAQIRVEAAEMREVLNRAGFDDDAAQDEIA